jgi:hypothetical protein
LNKNKSNRSRFLSVCGGLSFALSGLEIKEVTNLFPGAYAPGYALFRPFWPNKGKNPPILHRGLIKKGFNSNKVGRKSFKSSPLCGLEFIALQQPA